MPQPARPPARVEMPQLARNQRASVARHAAYRSAACRSAASVVRGNDLWPFAVAMCSFLWRAAKQGARWLRESIHAACRPLEQREWATALEPREGGAGEEEEQVSVEDAWEALELEKDASAAEAQRAYHKACRRFHSCRNGSNPEAMRAYRRAGRAFEALRKAGRVSALPGAATSAVEAELLEEEVMHPARPWEEDSTAAGGRGLAKPRGGRGGRDRQEPAVDPYAEFTCGKGEVAASIRAGTRRRLSALLLEADVGSDLGRGSTPLHFCAFFGREAAAKMIVSRAGPLWWKLLHVANDDGLLPADVAARFQPGTEVASTFASWQRQADALRDLWQSTGRTRINRWSLLRIFRIMVVTFLGWRLFPRCRQLIGLAGVAYSVYSVAVPKRLHVEFPALVTAAAVLALLWWSPYVLRVWSLTPWTVVAVIQLTCSNWVVPAQYRKALAASGAMMMFEKGFVGCSFMSSLFDCIGLEIALLYAGIDFMDSLMYQVIFCSGWVSVIWLQLPVTIVSALALLHALAASRLFVRTRACICSVADACCSVAHAVRSIASLRLCWSGRSLRLLGRREAQRRKRIQAAERGLREEDKRALDSRLREAIAAADAEAGHVRRPKGDAEQSPGKRRPPDQDRRRAEKQSHPQEVGEVGGEPTSEPEAEPAEAPRPAAEKGARAAPRKRGEEKDVAKQPSPRQPQPEHEERQARREEECRRRERTEEEERRRRRAEGEERQRLETRRAAAEKMKLQAEQQAKKAAPGKARAREEEKGFETETPQSACSSSPASGCAAVASAAGSPQVGPFPRARARTDGQPLPPPIGAAPRGARPSTLPSKPPSPQSVELLHEPMRAVTPAREQGSARTPPAAPSGAPPGPPTKPAARQPPLAPQAAPPGLPPPAPPSTPATAAPRPGAPRRPPAPAPGAPPSRAPPGAPPKAPASTPLAPRWAARPGGAPPAAPAKAAPRAPVAAPVAAEPPAKAAPKAPAAAPGGEAARAAPQGLAPLHLRPPPAAAAAAKHSEPPSMSPPSPPTAPSPVAAAEARPAPPPQAAQLGPPPAAEGSAPRCPWAAAATAAACSSSPGGAAARTPLSAQLSACAPPQAAWEPGASTPTPAPAGPPGLSEPRAPPMPAARAEAPAGRTGRRVRCDGATDAEPHFVVQPYEADLSCGYVPLKGGDWLTVMYWQAGDEAEPDGWCYGGVLGRPDRVGWLPQRILQEF